MFERFTKGARSAVIGAQQEARELGHTVIGTEHVLLALTTDAGPAEATPSRADPRQAGPGGDRGGDRGDERSPSAVAVLLRDAGADRQRVRAAIVAHVGDRSAEATALADRDAEDAAALKAIGIDLNAVRAAIEENFGAGSLHLPQPAPKKKGIFGRFYAGSGHIPFSPRAKKVLELSLREALRLKHNYIAREHIMLGILREGEGLAALILAELEVDTTRLRADLTDALSARAA
ncbi:Clp protease N-terminal domain-containing protein [Actinoplanes sp. NPDC023936]|uniref:Clp protease N-terminal domain-containing protein n=1 Tax=Actinoplanes sp. NPDC023936 TaxID=3154910 RepID=UPI0033C5424C